MADGKLNLAPFRAEIDAIDDQIVALFKQRAEIVRQVGGHKRDYLRAEECFIRSQREADLVRSIGKRFEDSLFSPAAAMQIWRLVICASLQIEAPLRVSVATNPPEIYWLAREYFGNFTQITQRATPTETLQDLTQKKGWIGVFDQEESSWWQRLPNDVAVFACLPFLLNPQEHVRAVAAAKLTPEPTGDDLSLLHITATSALSDQITKIVNMPCRILQQTGSEWLVEAQGFISPATVYPQAHDAGIAIRPLGAYARPLPISPP